VAAFQFISFTGFARIPAARELLLTIPPEVTSEAVNYPVEGPELIHFRRFFEVWDGVTALNVVRGSEPDPTQKLPTLEWRKQYGVRIRSHSRQWAHQAVMN
jgi:nuclear pore complex protein Nup107